MGDCSQKKQVTSGGVFTCEGYRKCHEIDDPSNPTVPLSPYTLVPKNPLTLTNPIPRSRAYMASKVCPGGIKKACDEILTVDGDADVYSTDKAFRIVHYEAGLIHEILALENGEYVTDFEFWKYYNSDKRGAEDTIIKTISRGNIERWYDLSDELTPGVIKYLTALLPEKI